MAPTFMTFKKRGLSQNNMLIATIVLVVIASLCTIVLAVVFVLKWRPARSTMEGTEESERPATRMSERSFSSPDAKVMAISSPVPQYTTSTLFPDIEGSPFRPDRPAQPWGKAFVMQRSRHSMYSQLSPSTNRSSTLPPTASPLTAPKKVFDPNRTRRASLASSDLSRLPHEDMDDYRPVSERAPFKKPHPFPISVRGRPNGDAASVGLPS